MFIGKTPNTCPPSPFMPEQGFVSYNIVLEMSPSEKKPQAGKAYAQFSVLWQCGDHEVEVPLRLGKRGIPDGIVGGSQPAKWKEHNGYRLFRTLNN
ncbi:olfactory receptor Olr1366 isoform X2 [Rattus norvegicus]|uniref:olfactory receptor Olr1366 isoform X2 n=1 Tax=Rattus norvegicus TaxID=10116 RepID=UPI001917489A|nr:olfactory receptor Olr1366 isoform X3 [Rattus norvegicus]